MKRMSKALAGFSLVAYFWPVVYSLLVVGGLVWRFASPNESPAIVQVPTSAVQIVAKLNTVKDMKLNKPGKIEVTSIHTGSKTALFAVVRSYFWANDIHTNLPFIQYKFPLSEHNEAG